MAVLLADRKGTGQQVNDLVSVSTDLTAYLALLTLVVAIIFTYHELRAKVRADPRPAVP